MTEIIKIYDKTSKEFQRLQTACDKLNTVSSDRHYEVKDVYFDYGQNWKWTTIIAYYKPVTVVSRSYQALSPRQHRELLLGNMDTVINELLTK